MLEDIEVLEKIEGGIAFDCDGIYFIRLDKGVTVSDHLHPEAQLIYLLEGQAEVTVGEEVFIMTAPKKIKIKGNVYHKFYALTNLIAIELKGDVIERVIPS